jgi:hypothetical protein
VAFGAEKMIALVTTTRGHKELQIFLNAAPQKFSGVVTGTLLWARNWFVGKKGAQTRSQWAGVLKTLHRSGRGGKWDIAHTAPQFKGWVDKFKLTMGFGSTSKSGFPSSLSEMEEGFEENSGTPFFIPFYDAMQKAGINIARYSAGRKTGFLAAARESGTVQPAIINGRVFYRTTKGEKDSKGRGVIIGMLSRHINVPKQFSFVEEWETKIPTVEEKLETNIERMIVRELK